MARDVDRTLLDALTQAYTARAKLFHAGVKAANVDLLIAEIDSIEDHTLTWDNEPFGISATAMDRVMRAGGVPHHVFAHPEVLTQRPISLRTTAIS